MSSNPDNRAPEGVGEARTMNRMRGFVGHLLGYFIGMIVIVPLNLIFMPDDPWFLVPLVGWGGALALHAAYVMGFFDHLKRKT